MIVVAVPVKDLRQRQAAARARARRPPSARELARAMLRDVLRALARRRPRPRLGRDPRAEAAAIARALRRRAARPRPRTAATPPPSRTRRPRRRGVGADAFLTIPGDVPCVTADEIRALVARAAAPPRRGLRPVALGARHQRRRAGAARGDAAALRRAVVRQPPRRGARAAAWTPRVLASPASASTSTRREDLAALLADGAGTRSARLVAGWRIARARRPARRGGPALTMPPALRGHRHRGHRRGASRRRRRAPRRRGGRASGHAGGRRRPARDRARRSSRRPRAAC